MQQIPEIESIFNPRHHDGGCDYIAHLLTEYESIISECMDNGNYKDVVTLPLAILNSLTRLFEDICKNYMIRFDQWLRNLQLLK